MRTTGTITVGADSPWSNVKPGRHPDHDPIIPTDPAGGAFAKAPRLLLTTANAAHNTGTTTTVAAAAAVTH